MPKLYNEYFSESITEILFKLFDKYNIYDKISYIIVDNALNSDTMIKGFKSSL